MLESAKKARRKRSQDRGSDGSGHGGSAATDSDDSEGEGAAGGGEVDGIESLGGGGAGTVAEPEAVPGAAMTTQGVALSLARDAEQAIREADMRLGQVRCGAVL